MGVRSVGRWLSGCPASPQYFSPTIRTPARCLPALRHSPFVWPTARLCAPRPVRHRGRHRPGGNNAGQCLSRASPAMQMPLACENSPPPPASTTERGRQPPHRDELLSPRRGQSAIVSAAQSDHQPRPQAEVTPTCPLCTYSLPQTGLTWGSERGESPTSLPLLTSLACWGSFPWGFNLARWVGLFPLSLPVHRASDPCRRPFSHITGTQWTGTADSCPEPGGERSWFPQSRVLDRDTPGVLPDP